MVVAARNSRGGGRSSQGGLRRALGGVRVGGGECCRINGASYSTGKPRLLHLESYCERVSIGSLLRCMVGERGDQGDL